MSIEYWISAKCPECGGANGNHEQGCKIHEPVIMSRACPSGCPGTKPLRWQTGFPGKEMNGEELLCEEDDHFYFGHYWHDDKELSMGCDRLHFKLSQKTKYIPLSAILDLIQEEGDAEK